MFDYEPIPHPDSHKSFIVIHFDEDGETSMHTMTFAEIKENLASEYWGENIKVHTTAPEGQITNEVGLWIFEADFIDPKKREW